MRRSLLLLAVLAASPASAQLRQRPAQPAPVQNPIDVLRAEFAAQVGATTVYFGPGVSQLSPQGKSVLAAQALWLRQHSAVPVRIEGYGDTTGTRDHALALGARRANEVRDYLLLMGVPAAQVTAMSWGKERPGAGRAVTAIVQ
ncbi:MAG TPA: OmpA family protein [Sphingomicrobium sp.]